MIIFDLDGTLADCEHRRHFVDPAKNINYPACYGVNPDFSTYLIDYENPLTGEKFQPDYQSFYGACHLDTPIEYTGRLLTLISTYVSHVEIWSGRCESVREKTLDWIQKNSNLRPRHEWDQYLKMRPIGNTDSESDLKEGWLDDHIAGGGNKIDFVFDSEWYSIDMWRRRGVFVFNCSQKDGEF